MEVRSYGYAYYGDQMVRHVWHQPEELGPANLAYSRGALSEPVTQMHVYSCLNYSMLTLLTAVNLPNTKV
jgi:hypothetical protein